MITVEDLRNPSRKSGFNYVASNDTPSRNTLVGQFFAQAGLGNTHGHKDSQRGTRWKGPQRRSAEEAAQDYCDYVNGLGNPSTPQLRQAGHSGSREAIFRDEEVEHALGVLKDARAQRKGRQGYVYCITEHGGEFVKIGYSTNPEARVGELQTGNPRLLRLVGKIPGTMENETALHQRFSVHHELDEWFRPTNEIWSLFEHQTEEVGDAWKEIKEAITA